MTNLSISHTLMYIWIFLWSLVRIMQIFSDNFFFFFLMMQNYFGNLSEIFNYQLTFMELFKNMANYMRNVILNI